MWTPAPFLHEVTIEMEFDLQGVYTQFTMTGVYAENASEAAEYLRFQILALKERLNPPPRPRKPRKAAARAKNTRNK